MIGRPTFWFISPAHRRYPISEIVFAQREWALEKMRAAGVEAECVVISDDHNLKLAERHGFALIKRNNDYLGCRWGDGYQFAAESGADYVCPIGSDSWLDPAFILENLPDPSERVVVYSRHYAVVRPDGKRRAQLTVVYDGGTTMFYPTAVLESCGYRPIPETAQRGCDGHTIKSIKAGGETEFRIREKHLLETTSFQSSRQITDYDALIGRWGVGETDKPFDDLPTYYPRELVDAMRELYAKGVPS